jgi:hypothetical protein
MTYDGNRHMWVFRAAATVAAVALLAGPAAVSAQGAATEASPAPVTRGGGFSLRHIPEALPVSSAPASDDSRASAWYRQESAEPQEDLSMTRAVLSSLLLPGLGDWYAGRRDRAKTFFIVEGALWTAFVVFRIQGNEREDAYKDLAQTFAGVQSTDHSDDFYSVVGQYNSSDEYASDFKKDSRLDLWPDVGYDAMERYYLENRVADFEEWSWGSFENRVDYREMRSSSKLAYRRSGYVLAAAALNRVIAAVFAYQAVKSSRSDRSDERQSDARSGGYRLEVSGPGPGARDAPAARVSLIRSF